MKKKILGLMVVGFLLVGVSISVAGDLIVNGRVGIGTTNPSHSLNVVGGVLRIANSANSRSLYLYYADWADATVLSSYDNINRVYMPLLLNRGGSSVGIGTLDPGSYRLYVAGTAYSTGGWTSSDIRFKRNITSIDNALGKVLKLSGVSYEWKTDKYEDKGFPEGKHYGVIAQDIEKVLPEVVKEGPKGEKSVAYTELIPILIEAMKEQQKVIQKQQKEIEELKTAVDQIKIKVVTNDMALIFDEK